MNKYPQKSKPALTFFHGRLKKTFKGLLGTVIGNGLVKDIQDAVDCESAHENDHLHEEIAHLRLDERDALQAKLNEMHWVYLKEHRGIWSNTFN